MKEIVNLRLPKHLGAFPSLKNVTQYGLAARNIFLSNMSAYPMGSHAVGRIQALFYEATNLRELLEVTKKLRDITKYASDIIFTMETTRVDKYTLNRTEIIAYIELNASASLIKLTPEEMEFVAYLIVAPETGDSGWNLAFDKTDAENKIIQFSTLYRSIASAATANINSDGALVDAGKDVNVIYDPETDAIVSLHKTRRFNKAVNDAAKRAKKIKGQKEQAAALQDVNDDIANGYAIYHLASMRMIDHYMMLLTSVDIWPSFISPRLKTEASVNNERAKSLRTFSAYLHTLLMYPHIFSIEIFMGSYDKLTGWIKTFMPLSKEVSDRYDLMIRKHDLLQAREDALNVLSLLDEDVDNPTGSTILGLPLEIQTLFELEEVISYLDSVASKVPQSVDITSLKDALTNDAYKPYIYAHPIAEYQIVQNLSNSLILGHAVADQVNQAAVGAMNGVPRFYTDEIISRVKAVSPVVPFGFSCRMPMVDRFADNTESSVINGKLHFTPLTPNRSWELQRFIRKDKIAEIFKASSLLDTSTHDFMPAIVTNRDGAHKLRDIMMRDIKSLYPASIFYHDTVYTPAMFSTGNEFTDKEAIKRLLEAMTGMSFTLIKNEIGSEFLKKTWATFLSSFAILYVVPSDSVIHNEKAKGQSDNMATFLTPHMVVGYGKPYGVDYASLISKQSSEIDAAFVQITDTVYLRFLTSIPVPTDALSVDPDFHLTHPHYYFAGNSKMMTVDRWVMDDGLLHHTMAPAPKAITRPKLLLDRSYAYLNDRILMQTDMNYSIGNSHDETFHIPLTTKAWPHERFYYFIDYTTFGNYGVSSKGAAVVEMAETTEMIKKIEDAMEESIADSVPARLDEAKTDILKESHITREDTGKVDSMHEKAAADNDKGNAKPQAKKKKDNGDDEDDKVEGEADLKD